MASRLACSAITRQWRNLRNYMCFCHSRSTVVPKFLIPLNYCQLRVLHVKLYDSDVGLQRQRKTNSFTERADEETVHQQYSEELKQREKYQFQNQRVDLSKFKESAEFTRANDISEDPNIFGSSTEVAYEEEDAGDREEENFIQNPTRRRKKLSTREYAHKIKEYLNAHRVKDAIDVLEQQILKEDRSKPENYIYNLLISGCAKAGYTRKAFQLFTQMRQRSLKVTGGTYTSLFNACANAPSPVDGLNRANRLREILLEKSYEPNVMNYNAMIKAFGRCGDVKMAYLIADEMMEKNLPLKADTFNFLLQACATDKVLGFRHCLLTWHKMIQRHILPDYYTFNAVLRCVRDGGIGNLNDTHAVIQKILNDRQQEDGAAIESGINTGHNSTVPLLAVSEDLQTKYLPTQNFNNPFDNSESKEVTLEEAHLQMPNLLAQRPHLGSLVSLSEIKEPHDRLLLVGGMNGFLELMKKHHVTPDIETFTTLLEVVPPTNAAEKQILMMIRRIGLKVDIDFFNILIKKRSMRFDYAGGREVLSMIRTAGLKPDIITYGVMALGCQTVEESQELMQEMQSQGIRINIQILGAMLRQGCHKRAFDYVMEIMQISLDRQIRPNDVFLRHLHNFYTQCARTIDARHPSTKTTSYKKGHRKFCDKLRLYYDEFGLTGLKLDDAIRQVTERPYQQYHEPADQGIEPLKNSSLARKQKVRKYIKKIKLDTLRDDDVNGPQNRESERENVRNGKIESEPLKIDSTSSNNDNKNNRKFANKVRDSDRRDALETDETHNRQSTTMN